MVKFLGAAALSAPDDGWAANLLQRLRIGELHAPSPALLWVPGRYYGSQVYGTTTTNAATANRLYLTPLYFPRPRAVDRLGFNVTAAGVAGSVARAGIWAADPDTGMPAAVLVDGGSAMAVTATGAKEYTISATLDGLVWLGLTATAGTYTAFNTSMIPNVVGASALTSLGAVACVGMDSVLPATALPSMVGQTLAYGATSTPPAVMVRAA